MTRSLFARCSAPLGLAAATVLALSACSQEAPATDGQDDSFVARGKGDTGGVAEGTYEAQLVLGVANSASDETLRSAPPYGVGLSDRTTDNLMYFRLGDDGVPGTQDDGHFNTLASLDAIPYVGPIAFAKLLDYAKRTTPGKPDFFAALPTLPDGSVSLSHEALLTFSIHSQGGGSYDTPIQAKCTLSGPSHADLTLACVAGYLSWQAPIDASDGLFNLAGNVAYGAVSPTGQLTVSAWSQNLESYVYTAKPFTWQLEATAAIGGPDGGAPPTSLDLGDGTSVNPDGNGPPPSSLDLGGGWQNPDGNGPPPSSLDLGGGWQNPDGNSPGQPSYFDSLPVGPDGSVNLVGGKTVVFGTHTDGYDDYSTLDVAVSCVLSGPNRSYLAISCTGLNYPWTAMVDVSNGSFQSVGVPYVVGSIGAGGTIQLTYWHLSNGTTHYDLVGPVSWLLN